MKIFAKSSLYGFIIFLCAVSFAAQNTVPIRPLAVPEDNATIVLKKDSLATDTSKAAYGKLRVVSQPDSALVVVDSATQGISPFSLDSIASGTHTIIVRKKGYFVKKINIVLRPGATEELMVQLVRPGSIYVASEPPGARCFLDSKVSGVTPCEIGKLKPAEYDVRVELANRVTQSKHITVTENKCDSLLLQIPFTPHYLDSVATFTKTEKDKKARRNKLRNYLVAGVFAAFSIAILIMEATDN